MSDLAANVRRLMARDGLTREQLVAASGLNERTIRSLLNGRSKPHARTLHRLATGLGVSADELFQNASTLAQRGLEQGESPVIQELLRMRPELFDGWTAQDFEDLRRRLGGRPASSESAALEIVMIINRRRDLHHKVEALLESEQAPLVVGIVDLLHRRVEAG